MTPASRPRALTPGAKIRLIAPSSPFDTDAFERGRARLAERYEVQVGKIFERHGFLAGSDAHRLAEIHSALEDDSVTAIVAARGGYGATRLLPSLDLGLISRARKLLVGFSDVTALHAAWARAGIASLHAFMVGGLGNASQTDFDAWVTTVEGGLAPAFAELRRTAPGDAEGIVRGGNLAILAALVGTPFALDARDAIVVLEDIGERPYRIDRMLTTLLQSGAFEGARAFVVGDFMDAKSGPDGTTAQQVLEERLSTLGAPVAFGAPVGHGATNQPVPLGTRARLVGSSLQFLEFVSS